MRTLADIYDRGARCFPHDVALIWPDGALRYRDLHARMVALAAGMGDLGVGPGDRVAILARNGPAQVLTSGACELSGVIAVPVNFRLAAPEVARILRDCDAAALVYEEAFDGTVAALRGDGFAGLHLIRAGDGPAPDGALSLADLERRGAGHAPATRPAPSDIAYLVYTSGTTGRAKGVMLDHASQVALAEEVVTAGGVRGDDSVLLVMPLYHIGAKSKQLAYALAGGRTHLRTAFDSATALDALAQHDVTATHLAPIMVQMLLDAHDAAPVALPALRTIYYASASMPVAVLRRAMAVFGPVFVQFYGLTETGTSTVFQAHHHVLDGPDHVTARLASAGQPTFRSDVRVVDAQGHDVPIGEPGEILLAGPTVMRGYWDQPELTAETLRDGWVLSGDIGRMDDEGFLFVVDRMKDVIITGGENVYPREVEEVLHAHPDVAQAAVIGVPDPKWGESVCAFVVPRDGTMPAPDALVAFVRERIAFYKKPREIRFVEALPRLPNGKVDKKSLRVG